MTTTHVTKAHNRSTRETLTLSERKTRYRSGQPIEIAPEKPSRVAIYGARREMKRKVVPLQVAMWVFFLLCFGTLGFGIVQNHNIKNTPLEKQELTSPTPVTIEYNPYVTPTLSELDEKQEE